MDYDVALRLKNVESKKKKMNKITVELRRSYIKTHSPRALNPTPTLFYIE